MEELPHCDDLFLQFFDRWYSDDDRRRNGFEATRPDLLQDDSLIGISQANASSLTEEWQREVLRRIETMIEATRRDWPRYLPVSGDIDLAWIAEFDSHYDMKHIQEVIDRADPSDMSNDYVVLCCEFGAAIGHVMRNLQPRLMWRAEWPYWESSLVDPKTGHLIAVFHWAINDQEAQRLWVGRRFCRKVAVLP
jgi:hypothetical protein